jgi:DNA-binding CsgD family transcriptional regulator
MNPVEDIDMRAIIEDDEDSLSHYGMPRRSGRYPWGSGENPYQHAKDFRSRIAELKKSGWKETSANIEKEFGMTLNDYRREISWAKYTQDCYDVQTAKNLKEKGHSNAEIGRIMGKNESSIRGLLSAETEARLNASMGTVNFLKEKVDSSRHGMIDVGPSIEHEIGVSRTKMDTALHYLENEGYVIHRGGIKQPTNANQQTNQSVLCKPGTPWKAIYEFDKIDTITDYATHDDGKTFDKFMYPASMDSKRLMIRYADDVDSLGARGIDKDGTIEIRRGCKDLSLGNENYSQVRILVDGTHYLKGMAFYSDDMPDGVDVVFNTNKTKDKPMEKVLKEIKRTKDGEPDPDNPFGSLIKPNGQSYYTDDNGNKQLSLINKRASEGDWSDWKDALPSQFLSKQPTSLIKKQLGIAKTDKYDEYDEICSLTNPTIKKHLLNEFASKCDGAAKDLSAAPLPGQKYHVIMPINSLKDTEIYAPRYENGTKVALVRYPHGGTFEIPILTVNNKNKTARSMLPPDAPDAVGITSKIAEQLSGADFDGDTVMVIPTHNGSVKISNKKPLDDLVGFDPKTEYAERPGMRYMKDPVTGTDNTQKQMGEISNLITDMTLLGAPDKELARAVRHSMVVIDAAKHKLDYKRSEIDNDIDALKRKYQKKEKPTKGGRDYGGAATLISRSKGEATVNKRQGNPRVNLKDKDWYDPTKPEGSLLYKDHKDLYYAEKKYDKDTGLTTLRTVDGKKITYNAENPDEYEQYNPIKKVDEKTGDISFTNKAGTIQYKFKARTQKSTNMDETDDAHTLVSTMRHEKELIYADYANSMKALANQARKEAAYTGKITYDKNVRAEYKAEYDDLMDQLKKAELNKGRERAVLRATNYEVSTKVKGDSTLSKSDIKKMNQMTLEKYRSEFGSVKRRDRHINISDRQWEAIQKGALHESELNRILNNTDIDELRKRAMPKTTKSLSTAKISKIKAMTNSGYSYSLEEIAKACGVSVSTVSNYLQDDKKKGAK